MRKLVTLLLLLASFASITEAGIITRPTKTTGGTSYTDGTIPHDSDLNGDVDTVYSLVNGNIEDANIKAGANIAASKILTNFTSNLQVTTAAAPCFVNINSALGADLKQWRICQNGTGVLSIATYTDAGALISTPLSIVRATGVITVGGGFTVTGNLVVSSGVVQISGLTAKSFLYSDASKFILSTSAPTNGQMLIGSTGNSPVLGTIAGTATHICTTLGAGTFALDFCANPALASPVISGTVTGGASYSSVTLTSPTVTNPTITGTTSIGNGATITTPIITLPAIEQIAFPATQNASSDANTLDDYEEGQWTPSVDGTATYTARNGTYTKIGRIVHINGYLQINAIGSGSTTNISGIPFTGVGIDVNVQYPCVIGGASTLNASVTNVNGRIIPFSSQSIKVDGPTAASTNMNPGSSIMKSGTFLSFSCTYEAAT